MRTVGEIMNRKEDYIAVFDSGVGGISVLRHLLRLMPGERYLYLGDSANAPYGSRTTSEVRQLSLNVAEKLMAEGVKALVVACNTATAAAIETLRQAYPDTIVIGIEPALKPAADRFPGGRIAVLATEVTLREQKFSRLMQHYAGNCQVIPIPAPGLVELIEAGHTDDSHTEALLRPLLGQYAGELDAVVLGCTHYPFAAKAITRMLGENTVLFDGGSGTARETKRRLEAAGLLRDGEGSVTLRSSLPDPKILSLSQALLELD